MPSTDPPPHTPLLAAPTAVVSVTCSYREDDDGAASWPLSSSEPSSSSLQGRRLPNQGTGAETPRWLHRTEGQMDRYVEDNHAGYAHGRHVVTDACAARATSSRPTTGGSAMHEAMASFITKLTFREMCVLCYEPSVVAYTILLTAYCNAGKIELAKEAFLEMLEAGMVPDVGRHGDMMLFYTAACRCGLVPPVSTFNFMLSSLQKHRLDGNIIHLWKHMVEMEEANNVVPNHFTYTVVTGSFVKEGLLKEAMDVLEATYSGMISLNARHGKGEQAVMLYEEMRAHDIVPSNYTCASLLLLCDKSEDYSKALSLFRKASAFILKMRKEDIQLDESLCMTLMEVCCKSGMIADADKILKEMNNGGMYARNRTSVMQDQDSSSKVLAYWTDSSVLTATLKSLLDTPGGSSIACELIRKLAREGEEASTCEAKFLHEQLIELGPKPEDSATATLICGKIGEAYHLFMKMADQGHSRDVVTISILVTHLTKHGKFQEVENIVHGCFDGEIDVYGLGGKLDKAAEMFAAAQELGLLMDEKISFNSMINAYATSGLHNETEIVFQERQSRDHVPDSTTYLALISAYSKGRCYSKAKETIRMMLSKAQIDEAKRICYQMQEIGVAVDLACCRAIMRVCLEHGHADEGILLFETTHRSLKPDSFMLSAAFHLYEHSGREP
ncbi:hypothetical protein VPH35_068708 [Triticum aestivum]